MMRNKINNEKRSKSDSNEASFNDDQNELHQPKQQRPSIGECSTNLDNLPQSTLLPNPTISFANNSGSHYYYNANPMNFQQSASQMHANLSEDDNKPISSSWRDAFPMSNLNMPWANVSIPSMPNISIPNLPSMPTITMPTMPSIPNLSMPNISMPSMPNINLPSLSDYLPLLGKNIKTWDQILETVKESRKKFSSICPNLPFNFQFAYSPKNEKLRIYYLTSKFTETTLYYCDVDLLKEPLNNDVENNKEKYSLEPVFLGHYGDVPNHHPRKMSITENYDKFNDLNCQNNFDTDFDIADCESDIDNNNSSGSPTSMALSSSSSTASNESYTRTSIDAAMKLRKSITSATNSISDLDTVEWKPLLRQTTNFNTFEEFDTNNDSPICYKKIPNDSNSPSYSKIDSQEEDLISQRKRIMINGILTYDFHPKMARFVFTLKNSIYWFDDVEMSGDLKLEMVKTIENIQKKLTDQIENGIPMVNFEPNSGDFPPYVPKKLTANSYFKANATICPHKPDLVAYTADYDLWVCDLISGFDIRLTNTNYSKTAVMAGRPSFVMQEEFARFTGFWWRPAGNDFRSVETILCEFVDESLVESISMSNWDGMNEIHRFPKAGSTNAKSTLKLVHFCYNNTNSAEKIRLIKIEDLGVKFESLFSEYEYLIRCNWLNDDVIWVQLLNRKQNHLKIVFLSISDKFSPQIIHEEWQEDHWYNYHEIFYVYKYNNAPNNKNYNDTTDDDTNHSNCDITVGSIVEFLWSSEMSGFRHLCKIAIEICDNNSHNLFNNDDNNDANNKELRADTQTRNAEMNPCSGCPSGTLLSDEKSQLLESPLRAKTVYKRQLTSGNWEVSSSMFWVNEEKDLIYFMGTKDSPLENHLYVVSSSQSSRISPRRLSKEDFTHTSIVFDPRFDFCIDFLSNLSKPPCGYLNRVIYPEDDSLNIQLQAIQKFFNLPEDAKMEDSSEYYDKLQNLGPEPHLFEYKLHSGELIYGFMFKPEHLEPGLKYPVFLEIYGGPEVQVVSKSFRDLRVHRRHLIASEGYVVVGFDSRGSKHRGVDFEKHIYKRFGQVEIEDQVEALQWLAANHDFINMNRVAIHGWSYGGYLSLMALVKRPDIFKCAIAGAPVTNWFLYDTGYTERYMGLPSDNEENYKRSNVITYVKNFPNEYNRLFIIHGLMDDNVHFGHSAQLIQALVQAGKPYSLNIFPNERHSLKKTQSSEHCEATLVYYLQQNL